MFKVGDEVIVNKKNFDELLATKAKHGLNSLMRKIVEERRVLKVSVHDVGHTSTFAGGWSWDNSDLSLLEEEN